MALSPTDKKIPTESEYDSITVQMFLSNNSSNKIQQIKFSNSDFICHRSAIPAFRVWSSILMNNSLVITDAMMKDYKLTKTPIHVIKATPNLKEQSHKNIYYFFNAFELVQMALRTPEIEMIPIRIVNSPDEVAMKYWAWFEVVKLLNSGSDASIDWVELRMQINLYMPAELKQKFFGCKKLMKQQLCDLVRITLRQYEYLQVLKKAQLEQERPLNALDQHRVFELITNRSDFVTDAL
jgi:hypothetical protein